MKPLSALIAELREKAAKVHPALYESDDIMESIEFRRACDPQTILRLCDKLEEAIALAAYYESMETWVDVKNLMARTNADPGVEAHDVFGEKAREFLATLTPK